MDELDVPEGQLENAAQKGEQLGIGGSLHRGRSEPDFQSVTFWAEAHDFGYRGAWFGPDHHLRAALDGAEEARRFSECQLSVPPAFFGARKLMLSSMCGSSAEKPGA